VGEKVRICVKQVKAYFSTEKNVIIFESFPSLSLRLSSVHLSLLKGASHENKTQAFPLRKWEIVQGPNFKF
jgi:hypothetical protein